LIVRPEAELRGKGTKVILDDILLKTPVKLDIS